ncbi:hypothetical protein JL101_032480 (plasmid) [Skermanella rosea]|uniref:Ribbon-helix-helix CopG family protein n=1 Tax=Skermanella cutis TaxID=2775420 RepID=A0ABX7BF65_9PROT|nr:MULTISPECIES: hypothetical protein [Skermanella]QQP92723.1 hypothetical protein IGS68_30135 [Skermanella sp. TT6]UEM07631.1 hypothetical protein JL101_032480 [Skermanella rosea]
MRKVEVKLYLDPDLASRVAEATTRFRSAGRKVSRNDVLEQLIEDGFRMWRRETEAVGRVEASIARLLDRSARHDRLLRSILLTLADGDQAEYRRVVGIIEREDGDAA